MKPLRILSTPATTHWWWNRFAWRISVHKCDCGYKFMYLMIPIIKSGSQKKALYRCPECAKNFATPNRLFTYTLTEEGWLRQ